MSLLFRHVFRQQTGTDKTALSITGIDLSQTAINLANLNLDRQDLTKTECRADTIEFIRADIMSKATPSPVRGVASQAPDLFTALETQKAAQYANLDYPILISNPPYVSARDFMRKTEFSVRRFEPKLALVPSPSHAMTGINDADVFYSRLLTIADRINARAIMFEVGDRKQARRVARLIKRKTTATSWKGIEIWNDQPTLNGDTGHTLVPDLVVDEVNIRGKGKARSVFAYRGPGEAWAD